MSFMKKKVQPLRWHTKTIIKSGYACGSNPLASLIKKNSLANSWIHTSYFPHFSKAEKTHPKNLFSCHKHIFTEASIEKPTLKYLGNAKHHRLKIVLQFQHRLVELLSNVNSLEKRLYAQAKQNPNKTQEGSMLRRDASTFLTLGKIPSDRPLFACQLLVGRLS